jgi:hypothetical protein
VFWCFTWVPVISQVFGYWLNQVTEIVAVPARIPRIFSLQNPHMFCKKNSIQILRFLTNFEVKLVTF